MTDNRKTKVVVAMSGGVDSSVAACLLHEQGYDVVGLFMRVGVPEPRPADAEGREHQGCCSASDASDARFVAGLLDIPFFALNFEKDFEGLIDYFADEYAAARTPNPCIICNQKFKFGRLFDYAGAVGARYVATGHHARVGEHNGKPALHRGIDDGKDQSYVLFGLQRDVLDRVMFPIGHLTKDQVRDEARRFGLPICDKPDSVEICFVPDRDYARIVKQRRPDAFREGDVVDADGSVIGQHQGIGHYTVGQRRGLGIAAGVPIYVTEVNATNNVVTIGSVQDLMCSQLTAERVNILVADVPNEFRAHAKIRYLHQAVPAKIHLEDNGTARVVFDEPQRAATPGQAVVFYDGPTVIGGGWIKATSRGAGDTSLATGKSCNDKCP
jgi:tRNA-uridine 2-sulfurtransferase